MKRFAFLVAGLVLALGWAGWLGAIRDPAVVRYRVELAGLQRPLRMVHLSDLHGSNWDMPQVRLNRIMDQVNTLEPDLVVVTGDFHASKIWDPPMRMDDAVQPLTRLKAPLGVWSVPGNHDDPALLRAALAAPFRHCGQHDFGAWRIVMLDSRLADEASGALSHAELARLDAALGALEGRQALVVLHHHPVTSHSAWLDTVALRDPDALFAVLDRHAGVRGLLWGHVHQVYEGARRDVRLMGTPSTCVQFLPRVPHFAVDTLPPAYRTLTLHADGGIDSQVHWVQ